MTTHITKFPVINNGIVFYYYLQHKQTDTTQTEKNTNTNETNTPIINTPCNKFLPMTGTKCVIKCLCANLQNAFEMVHQVK